MHFITSLILLYAVGAISAPIGRIALGRDWRDIMESLGTGNLLAEAPLDLPAVPPLQPYPDDIRSDHRGNQETLPPAEPIPGSTTFEFDRYEGALIVSASN